MTGLDLAVLGVYLAVVFGAGIWFSRRASRSSEELFASGRTLPWWAAGTSMIAASFASDTPLVVSSYVRSKGVWGNWLWWCLGLSTVLGAVLFARLWHRSGVLTENELTELRYAGRPAACLRGFKALYWGLFYASFAAGAGAVTGLAKVVEATLGWPRDFAVFLCTALAGTWVVLSGLWGIVATDVLQFAAAVAGSLATAWYAVKAAGGMDAVLAASPPERLAILPPAAEAPWFLGLVCIQWWAWKNSDGGGVLVQRMAACRSERHAVGATLWYAVGQYALRAWPWVVAALASFVLFPALADPEMAYPMLLATVLPAGVKGFVLAWFLVEFMSGVAQFANFGASLLVRDGWQRFVKPDATEVELVRAGRAASLLVVLGAWATAQVSTSVRGGFETILQLTAGIGTVYVARWLWWRVNAWSEVAAFAASIPVLLLAPAGPFLERLVFIVGCSVAAWLAATLLTRPEPMDRLLAFYRKSRPPAWGWGPVAREAGVAGEPLAPVLVRWLLGSAGIYAVLFGLGGWVLGGGSAYGPALLGAGAVLIYWVARRATA